MSVKCKIKMTDKVLPVEGSATGPERDRTGTCPECQTPGVMLSIVGEYVRAHTVSASPLPENNPKAGVPIKETREHKHAGSKVSTGLSEPVTDLTDTGARTGDPRAAEQRRTAEIEGAAGIGVVQVPRKVPGKGKLKSGAPRMTTKLTDVPATEGHVREALEYWRGRRITERTSDAVRKRQAEMVSSLSRRLEGFRKAREDKLPGKRGHLVASRDTAQGHRGPTLVRGRDTTPRVREAGIPWSEGTDLRRDGTVRKCTTFEDPLGRERFDRKITDVPEPPKKRSAAERNRWRKEQRAKFMSK